MTVEFNKIKAKATALLNNYKNSLPTNGQCTLNDLYVTEKVKEQKEMFDFYVSCAEYKAFMRNEYSLDDPEFNRLSGFTLEYRELMQ